MQGDINKVERLFCDSFESFMPLMLTMKSYIEYTIEVLARVVACLNS